MRSLERKLWRDAWHYRSQLGAIVAVVTCGIALFVALRSMNGHLRRSRDEFYDRYRFAHVFAPLKRAPIEVFRDVARIPGVADVAARIVQEATIEVPGLEEPAVGRLVSIPVPRTRSLNEPYVLAGRWPLPDESNGVLASAAFARANRLVPGDSVGAVLHGRWRWLRVTGIAVSPEYVYEIGGAALFPDNLRFGVLWMSESELAGVFDMTGAYNDLAVTLADTTERDTVIEKIDALLRPYGSFGAYGRESQVSHVFLNGEIEETQVTSVLLPAIFLGVTAFLLHLVLSRLVGTQREQIATLKAFGYSNASIGGHYLGFSLIPVGIGSILGTIVGLWFAGLLAGVYARFFQFPSAAFVAEWSVVATAVVVGTAAGVLGALSAVAHSSSLPPAEAMRPETPPRYRGSFLERLPAIRHLGPAAHIVARNLERRFGKALLSVFGLALAGGLVVTVMSMFDAVDLIKDVQFHAVMREDVTLSFEGPRSRSAMAEIASLPGVLVVEPFRSVPVRLRAGARERRTVLIGLDAQSQLRQIRGASGIRLTPPTHGILVSPILAALLDVKSGDRVTVEVLEGERPTSFVYVAGVTDEMVGTSVYMESGALDHLTGHAATSGAWLAVDPRHVSTLYATLKQRPAVSGVAVREVQLRSFEQTISESFNISLVTMLSFAIVIAFGIVYNSARVALSERGRELASLRVLGFTRGEVTSMLLGEQSVLAVASLPVAFLVGWTLCWLVSVRFDSDLFRIPIRIEATSYLVGIIVIVVAGILSAVAVHRRVGRLDLVEVLKTRE
jgi:putative ABC transport system permease protein